MKAVILAAGKGTRMGDLTKVTPKPLLKINGKTLLEWKMDVLPGNCTEVILIISYLGDQIKKYFGDEYRGMKVTYVEAEPNGTGFALWAAKEYLTGQFIVMCGDDLYARADIAECLKYPYSMLVHHSDQPISGGKITLDNSGNVADIVEGRHEEGATVWAGIYVLQPDVFDLPLLPKAPASSEYGLPQTLLQLTNKKIHAVFATAWYQVTAPEDLTPSAEILAPFTTELSE